MKNDLENIFNTNLSKFLKDRNYQTFSKEYIEKNSGEIFNTVFNEMKIDETIIIISYDGFKTNELKDLAKIHFLNFVLSESYFFQEFFNLLLEKIEKYLRNDISLSSVLQYGYDKRRKLVLTFRLTFNSLINNENTLLYNIDFQPSEIYLLTINRKDRLSIEKSNSDYQYLENKINLDLKYGFFFDYFNEFYSEGSLENILIDSERRDLILKVERFRFN